MTQEKSGIISNWVSIPSIKDMEEILRQQTWAIIPGVVGWVEGTNTVLLIAHGWVPKDRFKDFSYGHTVVGYRPQKEEPYRTWLTVGSYLIDYEVDLRTPTAEINTLNLIINSTISTPGSRYMCCDIKNFYLVRPLISYEHIKIPIDILPEEIIKEYNLMNITHNWYIYCEIWREM